MVRDSLGDRMKHNYENCSKTRLIRRMPVAIRLDGCHFHTFTRGFDKPFDECMMQAMKETMVYLVDNIQGCVFGYTQSDEITLILVDYQSLDTTAWFDNKVQKICSVSASMATCKFINSFKYHAYVYSKKEDAVEKFVSAHEKINDGVFFDSRCFNIPKEEVANLILWRQQDAARNSVNGLAQTLYPFKKLKGLNVSQVKELLKSEKGIDWDSLTNDKKWGSCAYRVITWKENENGEAYVASSYTKLDENMPMILGDDRNLVEQFILVGD